MKRDIDFIRKLLFDLERQAADCSLDALRNGAPQEADERLRYHVRLLIDAGLAKETDRTTAGQPCIRLTNAGHEFLDLCRHESRWREARSIVQEQSGGSSLSVLRAVLTKWAVEGISRGERRRRWRRGHRPPYGVVYREEPIYREPIYRVESYRYEREPFLDDEPIQAARSRYSDQESFEPARHWDREAFDGTAAEESLGVSLPVHMI